MSQEETLTALPGSVGKAWRSFLPFPLELERCACPLCSSSKSKTLMTFDQFGFPNRDRRMRRVRIHLHESSANRSVYEGFLREVFLVFFPGPP